MNSRTVTGAGFRPRLVAFGYDYLIILVYIALMTLATWLIFSRFPNLQASIFSHPTRADLFAFSFLILPVILYFSICESSFWQGSWGKRRRGLKVVRSNGQKAGFLRCLLRNVVKLLPWQIAHTSIFMINIRPQAATIGLFLTWALIIFHLISLLISRSHRTPYDWISGTAVVRE